MTHLIAALQSEAERLGFDLIGVTSTHTPAHFDAYKNWVNSRFYGNMDYLATERAVRLRRKPNEILPECKSIIVVGIRYPIEADNNLSWKNDLTGRIAAYACGMDYHLFVPVLLEKLKLKIEKLLNQTVNAKIHCDTGPILEKSLAMRAGLGWIGKNTILINRNLGSFFFLGELFLDINLENSLKEVKDFCGTCRRCIEACPTQCIQDDRTIDASRCISYLTIENQHEIPRNLRSMMGNYVFGCDVCQLVCPWNRTHLIERISQKEFSSKHLLPFINLPDILLYSVIQFKNHFKKTPVLRAKYRGFLRNVVVAMGNSRNPEAIPSLVTTLYDNPDSLIRSHAAWALGQIEDNRVKIVLEKALKNENNSVVKREILAALEKNELLNS
ncbi:MAG TPA: tRNA epoxyqueuosine(34) reductase QueG [Anaerolineae bacterium]|nr:tRNA epoxyqueuosine(34) reductase QueG [Anaerolineae bacterium]